MLLFDQATKPKLKPTLQVQAQGDKNWDPEGGQREDRSLFRSLIDGLRASCTCALTACSANEVKRGQCASPVFFVSVCVIRQKGGYYSLYLCGGQFFVTFSSGGLAGGVEGWGVAGRGWLEWGREVVATISD